MDIPAISTPAPKSLEAPLRKKRETSPLVVGVQVKVTGLPAVTLKPTGRVKGLGFAAKARRGAATNATRAGLKNFMVMILNDSE